MKPNNSDKKEQKLKLGKVKGKELSFNFDGGRITSDAGIVLIAELDKKLKITEQFSQCFQDYRHSSYTDYSLHNLLAQRIYSLILGYEDVNDHDLLRYDPALEIALRKINNSDSKTDILAGKSTINRLEYCPLDIIEHQKSRYHKIELLPEKMENMFIQIFLQSYKKEPKSIVLDMDVTDDQVHGEQEGAYFNKYYDGVCYAPLYIFCGRHLLVAKLRSSNVDPAAGALEELTRVIRLIRQKWKRTKILVRGDSAYSRNEIMNLCEEQPGVDFALAMATNQQLKLRASDTIAKTKKDYEARLEPVTKLMTSLFSDNENTEIAKKIVPNATWFRSLCYQTEDSWSKNRRVVTKVEYGYEGLKMRHVVTSLPPSKITPSLFYTKKYCPRGEMENRIKEQQLDLFADRTSTRTFASNQLRLWLSSIAYVVVQALREKCLVKTDFEVATVGTIRLHLMKLGAKIVESSRKIKIEITSACVYQDILSKIIINLQLISNSE